MRVTIIGPNLRDQSRGDFHVHAEGCADIARTAKMEPAYRDGWTLDAKSREHVADEVFADIIDENAATAAEYVDQFHFFPCVAGLPASTD